VRCYLADLQRAVVHYGDTTLFFAEQMARFGPTYVSAVAMEEVTVLDYMLPAAAMAGVGFAFGLWPLYLAAVAWYGVSVIQTFRDPQEARRVLPRVRAPQAQREHFDAETQALTSTLGAIRAEVVRLAVSSESDASGRVRSQVGAAREQLRAMTDALAEQERAVAATPSE
jgi:ElaB/YqjD/DUF883 family membrane-anchored ribosome-binding protein